MVHDPMCPIKWLHGTGPSGFTKAPCQCDLIERVRAAQRETDALIVEAIPRWDDDEPDAEGHFGMLPCLNIPTGEYTPGIWIPYDDAAEAIRAGGS